MGRSAAAACYAAPKEPPADLSSAYAPTHLAGATARSLSAAARASPGPGPRKAAARLGTRTQWTAPVHPDRAAEPPQGNRALEAKPAARKPDPRVLWKGELAARANPA